MKYKIESRIGGGMSELPPFELEVEHPFKLDEAFDEDTVLSELCNDYGEPFGVGATLTITRVA